MVRSPPGKSVQTLLVSSLAARLAILAFIASLAAGPATSSNSEETRGRPVKRSTRIGSAGAPETASTMLTLAPSGAKWRLPKAISAIRIGGSPVPLGHDVFVPGRMLAIAPSRQKSGLNERVQPPRQHVGGDLEALREFLEPGHAAERVAQNEDAPPFPDPIEAAGDRAVHGGKAGPLHVDRIA